jgi:hypothetical protein
MANMVQNSKFYNFDAASVPDLARKNYAVPYRSGSATS